MRIVVKVIVLVVALFASIGLLLDRMFTPGSILCCYQIYKQPDGTFELWNQGRTSSIEQAGLTYEQAKALQIQKCRSLYSFMLQTPSGDRVK